jgi:hypothetical protein
VEIPSKSTQRKTIKTLTVEGKGDVEVSDLDQAEPNRKKLCNGIVMWSRTRNLGVQTDET